MYEEVDLLLIAILALFPTWIAHFNKILDNYETFQKKEMKCPIKPTTNGLKMAVYAAKKLGFDFSRNCLSGTNFTRYCTAVCWTIVSPMYRIVKNLNRFFYSGALFEYTTNVVLQKMIETFILYQLLESPFGKYLRCIEDKEIISILSDPSNEKSRVSGVLTITHKKIIFQHKRYDPMSEAIVFDSIHAFANDKDIQECIFRKQIGEIEFSEISYQMLEMVREFVNLLSPIVSIKLININIPRLQANLKHRERTKKTQKENSPFDIIQHKSDAKFMRALILYTYMSDAAFDSIRESISRFIHKMSGTRIFPDDYIDNVVKYAELFYKGEFVINTDIVDNRYFREIKSANDLKPFETIQCDLIHEKIKDND